MCLLTLYLTALWGKGHGSIYNVMVYNVNLSMVSVIRPVWQ